MPAEAITLTKAHCQYDDEGVLWPGHCLWDVSCMSAQIYCLRNNNAISFIH